MKPYFSLQHFRGDGSWGLINIYSDVGGHIAKFYDEELANLIMGLLNGHAFDDQSRAMILQHLEQKEEELYKKFEDEGII